MSIADLTREDCPDPHDEDSGMLFNEGEYKIIQETKKAYLIRLIGEDGKGFFEHWLPKSQVEIHHPEKKLFIPEWLWDKYN